MERYYSFAGISLVLDIPDNMVFPQERTLAPFRIDRVENAHYYSFKAVEKLTPPFGRCIVNSGGFCVYPTGDGQGSVRYIGSVAEGWESAYIRAVHTGYYHEIEIKLSSYSDRLGVHTVLGCLAAEDLVAKNSGVILHSSYIGHRGGGIVFTAPSETGKSTQADLWANLRGAEIINSDRSVLRVMNGETRIFGVPFAGSSNICKNLTLPAAAIVYLKQDSMTTIRRLRGAEAFRRIWEGCVVNTWEHAHTACVSETVRRIIMSVPVFELACTPDESAINVLEGVLSL